MLVYRSPAYGNERFKPRHGMLSSLDCSAMCLC